MAGWTIPPRRLFVGAIKPQVIVMNNGPKKGLGGKDDRAKPITGAGEDLEAPYEKNSYLRLAKLPGVEGIWQGHLSLLDKDPNHNTAPDMIANTEDSAECQGHGISAVVASDGKFVVTNSRNGFSKTLYGAVALYAPTRREQHASQCSRRPPRVGGGRTVGSGLRHRGRSLQNSHFPKAPQFFRDVLP